MEHFADRLIQAIKTKGNPCVIGLDTRYEDIPNYFLMNLSPINKTQLLSNAITNFNKQVIDLISELVPVVKINIAFYERLGIEGFRSFLNSINYAKLKGLIVIADVKRNDIGSTTEAYAEAYLTEKYYEAERIENFNSDSITSSFFIGIDSMMPIVDACKEYSRGAFFLVKTSNKGSQDFQDQILKESNEKLFEKMAVSLNKIGNELIGNLGYSAIGGVVGATFPEEAKIIRNILRNNYLLVPGYGKQGGSLSHLVDYFNSDGLGAIINSSRGIIHSNYEKNVSDKEFQQIILSNVKKMISEITSVIN